MPDDSPKVVQDEVVQPQPQTIDPAIKAIGQITDVNTDIVPYIKARYLKLTIIICSILLLSEAVWLSICFYGRVPIVSALEIAAMPFILLSFLWSVIKGRIEDAFMQQFAVNNNLSFQRNGLPDKLDGSIFSIGYGKSGRDMVNGSFNGFPLNLFNYSYTVGYGKHAHTYRYTIFRLDYPSLLPPIFLKVNWHEFGGEGIFFSTKDPEKIQLEGDFNKSFTLYTKRGLETETLEVFTPDFMEKIEDQWKNFSLEFIGNHIYIYSYHEISTKAELDNIYSLAQYLITKVGPLAERMKSDVTTMVGETA